MTSYTKPKKLVKIVKGKAPIPPAKSKHRNNKKMPKPYHLRSG